MAHMGIPSITGLVGGQKLGTGQQYWRPGEGTGCVLHKIWSSEPSYMGLWDTRGGRFFLGANGRTFKISS